MNKGYRDAAAMSGPIAEFKVSPEDSCRASWRPMLSVGRYEDDLGAWPCLTMCRSSHRVDVIL